MDLGLTGRRYLVTGASSGVGLAVATLLLAEGASVVGCARDGRRLTEALAALPRPENARTLAFAADVRDGERVASLVAEAAAAWGGLDGVVNNAGGSLLATWEATTAEQWRHEWDLKITSVLNVVSAARAPLADSGVGSVVNVNAILARQPESRLAATSAARAGLLNLTRTLATDLAAEGIRVNSVCLGLVDTGQWRRRHAEAGSALDYPTWQRRLAADRGIPLGRLGTAQEAAFAVLSLLSPRASYTTGATLDVGGGVARYL